MNRPPLSASEALAGGLAAMAFGGGLLLWSMLPPSPGVDGSDPNAAVARKVVAAVRSTKWGVVGLGHRWDEAKAAGRLEIGGTKETSVRDGVERRAVATLQVSAVRSAFGEGVAEAARQATGVGAKDATAKRKVRAELVQRCVPDCGDLEVSSVRFEGRLPEGVAAKGMEVLKRVAGEAVRREP